MTDREALDTLNVAIAEVEWNYPMSYAVAFETAQDALRERINRENGCEMCSIKPVLDRDGVYEKMESQRELVTGGWTSLYIAADEKGQIVLRACGDDYTEDYPMSFCPKCGRSLAQKPYVRGDEI